MAFCNIENKQAQGLAKIVAKDIANKRKAGTPYNIEDAMLYVYNLMIDNNQDIDRAITMAALVPKAVIAQVGQYPPNGSYLAPILGRVGELVSKATKFDSVIDTIGLREDYDQRLKDAKATKEESIQETNLKTASRKKLSESNLDVVFHELRNQLNQVNLAFLQKHHEIQKNSPFKNRIIELEFLGFAFFLHKFALEHSEIAPLFMRKCLKYFPGAISPGHRERETYSFVDRRYLIDKQLTYIKEIEKFQESGSYPKHAFISLVIKPICDPYFLNDILSSMRKSDQFLEWFESSLEEFEKIYSLYE